MPTTQVPNATDASCAPVDLEGRKPMDVEDSIRAQIEILKRLSDNDERIAWIEAHAKTFHALWDADPAFREIAKRGDVDGMMRAIEAAERS